MDVFEAIRGRRSCRKYLPDEVGEDAIDKILEAAIWAPSPANNQPWEFIIIRDKSVMEKIHAGSEVSKKMLLEKSGWKWLEKYSIGFLLEAPAVIAVVGDHKKTGADMFLEGGGMGYQHACAAAIQNMLLAAHALGFGTLWYTLFDQNAIKKLLDIDPAKDVIALVCLGKPAGDLMQAPRKEVKEKTRYL